MSDAWARPDPIAAHTNYLAATLPPVSLILGDENRRFSTLALHTGTLQSTPRMPTYCPENDL